MTKLVKHTTVKKKGGEEEFSLSSLVYASSPLHAPDSARKASDAFRLTAVAVVVSVVVVELRSRSFDLDINVDFAEHRFSPVGGIGDDSQWQQPPCCHCCCCYCCFSFPCSSHISDKAASDVDRRRWRRRRKRQADSRCRGYRGGDRSDGDDNNRCSKRRRCSFFLLPQEESSPRRLARPARGCRRSPVSRADGKK